MRYLAQILIILILSGTVSAECREKSCMTNEYEFATTGHVFHYNDVFNIGTTWYIIFDYPANNTNETVTFEFLNGAKKVHTYDNSKVIDSISFSGSTFSEEKFNLVFKVIINDEDNSTEEFELSIDVNKPQADDLFYLWGGMTVFWVSIGSYVLYISSKLAHLSEK
jgi:hypothetical protein|tara:strand:+ start:72 stop:569 length:498 start_codon:yes stop_codon:yes gene_type:complete